MYFTYILYSPSIDKYYTGYTENLGLRISRHNSGWGKFSSRGIPWKLVYNEEFENKSDAINRENEIKSKKSKNYIENLIRHAGGRPDSE
ncbi:MAG: GIY-YIG nuclease family protein [Ignavibacteria bacterium]|nr:GIY-YIG nuclease family protein [Ignavibacteria bacterium]